MEGYTRTGQSIRNLRMGIMEDELPPPKAREPKPATEKSIVKIEKIVEEPIMEPDRPPKPPEPVIPHEYIIIPPPPQRPSITAPALQCPIIIIQESPKTLCAICGKQLIGEESSITRNKDLEEKFMLLKTQLEDIITMSKKFEDRDLGGFNVQGFIKGCDEVKKIIDKYFETDTSAIDTLKTRMTRLRLQLHEVIKLSQLTEDEGFYTPSKDKLCQTCADFDKSLSECECFKVPSVLIPKEVPSTGIPEYMPKPRKMPKSKAPEYIMKPRTLSYVTLDVHQTMPRDTQQVSTTRLDEFEQHVDEVVDMTKYYQKEGLLTSSAEEFINSCKSVKCKIAEYKSQRENKLKLERLKEQVANLERITSIVQHEELATRSINSFLSCCKEFKEKLDGSKSSKCPTSHTSLDRLINQIDDSIILSKVAKKRGLVSESVDDFIKGCQQIKAKIESKEVESEDPKSQVINDLLLNINDIIDYISKYRDEGLVSQSVEDFYRTCELTRAKLVLYKKNPEITEEEIKAQYPTSYQGTLCDCEAASLKEPCEKCRQANAADPKTAPEPPPLIIPISPQKYCSRCTSPSQIPAKDLQPPPTEPPKDSECSTCQNVVENDSDYSFTSCHLPTQDKTGSDKSDPDVCNSYRVTNFAEFCRLPKQKTESVGYYEKKVSKKTTVKRFREKDGNIKEAYETVTIKQRTFDPRELVPSEASTFKSDSFDSGKSSKGINICDVAQTKGFQTVRDYGRFIKSETLLRSSNLSYSPLSCSCKSEDTILSKKKSETETIQFSYCEPFLCDSIAVSIDSRPILPM